MHSTFAVLQFTKKGVVDVESVLDEEAVIEAAINGDVEEVEVSFAIASARVRIVTSHQCGGHQSAMRVVRQRLNSDSSFLEF